MGIKIKPLQTSGIFEEKWQPPQGEPFIRYEASDEHWCRHFGIGEVVRLPARLYDVRDESGRLLGYSRHDPCGCRYGSLRIPVPYEQREVYFLSIDEAVQPSFDVAEVTTGKFLVWGESFICWQADEPNGRDLIRAGWIIQIGDDRMDEFVREVQMRQSRRRIDYRDLFPC